MSSEFGLGTLYYSPQDSSRITKIDLVIVGPLSSIDGHNIDQTWSSNLWPQALFLKQFPESRMLIFQRGFRAREDLRSAIQRLGGLLVDVLDKFRQNLKTPLVVCCQGLGGYVFLEAIRRSDSEDRRESLASAISNSVFLGVPLNDAPLQNLRSALRACRTIEQGLSGEKTERVRPEDVTIIASLLHPLKAKAFPITTFAETKALPYARNLWTRTSVIVDKQLASIAGYPCHELLANHTDIGSLDDKSYNILSELISNAVASGSSPVPTSAISAPPAIILRTQRAKVNVICHHIPYPENKFFQGREKFLDVIKERLIDSYPNTNETPAFALWGPPGQGKTQTALRFAFKHRLAFSYIFWVTADREEKLLQHLQDCAVAAKLRKADTDITGGARTLMAFLASTDQSWLLIYDNAVSPRLINSWWPQSKTGAILVTAQKQVFATSSVANDGLELDKLPIDTGIEMILGQIPDHAGRKSIDGRAEARKIVLRVSGLALGVQAAIGLINQSGYTLKQYNKKYNDGRKFLQDTLPDHSHRNFAPYPKGLFETLTDTIKNVSDEARDLLEIFSLLDSDHIQDRLLETASEADVFKSFDYIVRSDDHLPSLYNGLIARNADEDGQRLTSFHMHRLLQDCVLLNSKNPSLQQPFELAVSMVYIAIGTTKFKDVLQTASHQLKEYLPHVQTLHDFYSARLNDGSSHVIVPTLHFVKMLRKSAALCYKRGQFHNGLSLITTAQDILGEDPKKCTLSGHWSDKVIESMRLHHQHACIGSEIGNFELSLSHWEAAKQHYDELVLAGELGQTNDDIESYLGGIANSLNGLERNEEALTYYVKAFKFGPVDDIDSPYEVNFCRTLWANGQFDKAAERLCRLIELRAKAKGETDDTKSFVMGHMLYVLGNIRISQNKLEDAYSLHKRALKSWRKTYGEEHHKTGDAWHKKGWHEVRLQNFSEAKFDLLKALDVYKSGSDRRFRDGEIARTSFKLSQVLLELGESHEAGEYRACAEGLYQALTGEADIKNASEDSYDKLVSLWAR